MTQTSETIIDNKISFRQWMKSNKYTAFMVSKKSGVSLSSIQKLSARKRRFPSLTTFTKLQDSYPDISLSMFE